jgi:hypothetical protein
MAGDALDSKVVNRAASISTPKKPVRATLSRGSARAWFCRQNHTLARGQVGPTPTLSSRSSGVMSCAAAPSPSSTDLAVWFPHQPLLLLRRRRRNRSPTCGAHAPPSPPPIPSPTAPQSSAPPPSSVPPTDSSFAPSVVACLHPHAPSPEAPETCVRSREAASRTPVGPRSSCTLRLFLQVAAN